MAKDEGCGHPRIGGYVKAKIIGGIFLLIGAVSGLYGIILLGPVVWCWVVDAGNAIAETLRVNANAFVAFQSENPASVGVMALLIGAVFAFAGSILSKVARLREKEETKNSHNPDGRNPEFGI